MKVWFLVVLIGMADGSAQGRLYQFENADLCVIARDALIESMQKDEKIAKASMACTPNFLDARK